MEVLEGSSHPDSQGFPAASQTQVPLAVIGMSCRLPGQSNSPSSLWEFIERGGIASNAVPSTRFDLNTHYVGSPKPNTMRSPGGMYLESIDPRDFDAPFFNISREDAIAMDPQQRQLLEVVYEGLENAGITLESLDGAPVACFVASFTCDYGDMLARDPEDRPPGTLVGLGRAILSNRISHFLNIKGPSVTLDTACSGTLQGIDIASRYLQTREVTSAIVAGANLFLSPEHNMDIGNMKTAHSLSGRCHTFDKKADGYAKAEAVNAVILKRLDDAIRDGDPIRAVIRGTATNSDGRTPGIASPSSEAQARAIRSAYANAGISDLSITSYLECHGTGTQAGDPIELKGAASVFAPTRPREDPLRIGSIKSNIGHSEPSAGISGLLKTILALEKGIIPGNPTFNDPNPKIDFEELRVRPSKATTPWPNVSYRRASVNSFGFGGSNAHVIVDEFASYSGRKPDAHCFSYSSGEDGLFAEDDNISRPVTLVFSANDEKSLKSYVKALSDHLINPNVQIKLPDLAYTLSHRRTRHFHRAYLVTQDPTNIDQGKLIVGKKSHGAPRIGFVFTGQGAQWPKMGKALLDTFPSGKILIKKLDAVLQSLPDPPSWSLLGELTEARKPQHLRQPEFSQPIVTALQLVILEILDNWGIKPDAVVGHSSGEIAAACAAGYLTQEEAIKIAFYRGRAVVLDGTKASLGMLAVGCGSDKVQEYIRDLYPAVQIGCFNSPNSVTLSGDSAALEIVKKRLDKDEHFARLLQVDIAYHSKFMESIAACYENLLLQNCDFQVNAQLSQKATMYSSVTGRQLDEACNAAYWMSNMESPVLFDQAVQAMLSSPSPPDLLIEVGPSGALAGPISQITAHHNSPVKYCAALSRGKDAVEALFAVAGRLFVSGGNVDLAKVNLDENDLSGRKTRLIVDLPNYVWNHSTKYWHESDSSKDWRFRKFPHHDLLGGKVLGTSWQFPSFSKTLRIRDQPWLRDHGMGSDVIFPAAGFISIAIEAMYQGYSALRLEAEAPADQLCYRLRNVRFDKALVLEEEIDAKIMLNLTPHPGPKETWYDFKVVSSNQDSRTEHSSGLIRIEKLSTEVISKDKLAPLKLAKPGSEWYKAFNSIGYRYGPEFQKILAVEAVTGDPTTRNHISLTEPASGLVQSRYPMHPSTLDACIQSFIPSVWCGDRCAVDTVLLPAIIDDLIITNVPRKSEVGIAIATSKYSGKGRIDDKRNWYTDISVHDPETGDKLFILNALRYHKLPIGTDAGAEHTITRSMWNPDITFISEEQLANIAADKSASTVQRIVDLIAHKKPTMKVLEVDLGSTDPFSIWFEEVNERSRPTRALYSTYSFVTADANNFVAIHEVLSQHRNAAATLVDLSAVDFNFEEKEFDLVIIKGGKLNQRILKPVLQNIRGLLLDDGYVVLAERSTIAMDSGSGSDEEVVIVSDVNDLSADQIASIAKSNNFYRTATVSSDSCTFVHIFAAKPMTSTPRKPRELIVASLTNQKLIPEMRTALQEAGWAVLESPRPLEDIKPKSTVLIQDELFMPVLKSVSNAQWDSLKYLVSQGCKILWLTQGSQMNVTTPDNALIHGMFRTIRQEDTSLRLMTLDVHASNDPATIQAVANVLEVLDGTPSKIFVDNEFVERNGIIFVNRIVPDKLVNQFKEDESGGGAQPVIKSLRSVQGVANLRAERLNSLDALHYTESPQMSVENGRVEIEIIAAGLNPKDLAATQGIIPENEHLLGMEGSGVVTRVGKNSGAYNVGDRVAMAIQPTFANRVQCPVQYIHQIPDWLSFEEAATIPMAYLTSMYCLFNVGNLQKGQSILIHSAAGGVGIASIYLAKHIGGEIYVTVGSDEERSFLKETFGLRDDQVFSSRTTEFAGKIKEITQGMGVDLIINSLPGELLDESWRICADGGTMVEIGSKDIIDRHYLSMEPFGRNCSYRPVDFSHKAISTSVVASLMTRCFELLQAGYIKPINPITRFGFDSIPEAFAYMRDGQYVGKVVITDGERGITANVPIRPTMRVVSLQPNVSYLIVGGLKGICGSLAVDMAQHGAKHIIAMTRSGISDDISQAIVRDCNSLGCEVQEAKADVCNAEDVERAFKTALQPIGGIVQGAVVLRDKPFEVMTLEDYYTAASAKVEGTWNLHRSSLAHKSPISFFTLLSSMSGVIGQKAQANYSAANVFMDAFSNYRHSQGLPAHSLDLGIIEEVGFAAREGGIQDRMDDKIWQGVNESMVRRMFKYSILQQTQPINPDSATQLIIGISLPQRKGSDLESDARFSPLFINDSLGDQHKNAKAGDENAKAVQDFLLLYRSKADKGTLVAAGVEVLNRQFMKTLRLTEAMEPARSLSAYGVDSLSAVEVRNWVRIELGVELTTLDITNATSLFGLCERLIAKMPVVEVE